jgi:hypothetical protein
MASSSVLVSSLFVALASAHGVILGAQGLQGSPSSVGFAVDEAIARNCTSISPCQQDATIIRDAEITANIVNSCGRTEIGGNIDVGENTENALAANQVTQVQAGTVLTVTIHQVNADGAGPYVCDLDQTSNTGIGFQNLTVTDNVPGVNGFSQAKTQAFDIKVTMPDDLKCIGGSTGDICTVRCRNNALAGPFGGCFAVQQTDTQANENAPSNINTAQKLDAVLAQVDQNKKDLPAAIAANQVDGDTEAQDARKVLEGILSATVVSAEFPTQTPDVILGAAPTTDNAAQPTAAPGNDNGNGNGNNNNNGNNGNGRGNNNGNGRGNNGGNQGNGNNRNQGGNNGNGRGNNNKRAVGAGLKWAKRIVDENDVSSD